MDPRRRLRGDARLHRAVTHRTVCRGEYWTSGGPRGRSPLRRARSLASKLFHNAAERVRDIRGRSEAPRCPAADAIDGAVDTSSRGLAFEPVEKRPPTSDGAGG